MHYKSLFTRNKLILLLIVFFIIRIIYSYFFGSPEIPLKGDPKSYHGYALAILNQADWLTNPDFYGDFREPVYPLFLALIYFIFGVENLLAVYFFHAVINILTVYYIYKFTLSVFDEKTSYLALIWSGFYSYYFVFGGWILREILIYFLVIYSFYYLWIFLSDKDNLNLHYLKNKNIWKFVIAFTILLHTDARYLFYIPFLLLLFILHNKFWVGVKQYLFVFGIFMLLLIPWTIRNYMAYDAFVLLNTRTINTRIESLFEYSDMLIIDEQKVTTCWDEEYPSEEERELIKKGLNPNNRSKNEIEAILHDKYPTKSEIKKRWYNFKLLWRPYHFVNEYKPWPDCRFDPKYSLLDFGLLKAMNYGTLLPFMIFAIFFIIIKKNITAYILVLPVIVHTILHILMWANGRYRTPIDSFVIILGCYGIIGFFNFIKRKLSRDNYIE
jgi:hypothetical protein